jgi:HEAT repeat protein
MINLGKDSRFSSLLLTSAVVLLLAGCSDPILNRTPQLSDLDNPNPMVKIMAIKWAGDGRMSSAVPQLVNLLEDEDRSVRLYSIQALQRITGTDCGYDYKDPADVRAEAVKCWREYIKTEQAKGALK